MESPFQQRSAGSPPRDVKNGRPGDETTRRPADRAGEYFRILDLHDEVGQLLTAILANLQSLRNYAAGTHLREKIRDTQHLVRAWPDGQNARQVHPHPDHWFPLLYAYAATDEQDAVSFPVEGFDLGSLSMRAVRWG